MGMFCWKYAAEGNRLWHERSLLEWIADEDYVVVTPDQDIYVETISLVNEDIRTIRARTRPNAVPAGVVAREIYGMPAWSAAELAAIRAEGQRVLAEERRQRAGGAAAPPVCGVAVKRG